MKQMGSYIFLLLILKNKKQKIMQKTPISNEAAFILQGLQDRTVKIIYFRRWMANVGVHKSYKPRQPQPLLQQQNTLIDIPRQPPPLSQEIQKQSKPQHKPFNVKYGDIIYFKCYLSNEIKGVIAGDGVASNKLECVQVLSKQQEATYNNSETAKSKTIQSKFARLIFQKCMFKVVNSHKYFYQDQLKKTNAINIQKLDEQEKQQFLLNKLEQQKKAEEEIDENESIYKRQYGQNVVYGQEIQLIHVYSNCIVTLNHQVLAKQHCCREMSLEEESSIMSNFRVMSLNLAKNIGEPVLYSDQITLTNCEITQWSLGVERLSPLSNLEDGLEVNASEMPMPLKIGNYIDFKTQKDIDENAIKGKNLQSGDIITIKNRNLGGILAIKRNRMLSEFLECRDVNFKDYETNTNKSMKQDYFVIQKLRDWVTLNEMYKLYIDTSAERNNNLNALWQIQLKDSLNYTLPTYDQNFLLKHVATGCFLAINLESDKELTLTYEGMKPECLFQLKSKKYQFDTILFSESVRIQSVLNPQAYIQCSSENQINLTNKSLKQNQEQTIFLMNPAPPDLCVVANRICSLSIYLFQFYMLLQEWGMEDTLDGKKPSYDYNKAFNTQKVLYDEIRQLFQSLDNLRRYLTNDGKPTSNEETYFKQKSVLENGIINILFCILSLVHFMIYGSAQKEQQFYDIGMVKKNNKQQADVPDKSPQKIAKMKLDPVKQTVTEENQGMGQTNNNCIKEIYQILLICVQGNSESSNYLLKLDLYPKNMNRPPNPDSKVLNYLLHQLKYHRESVSELLKQSVRYTFMENEEDRSDLEKWVVQLKPISQENIEDQTLFVEILSLIMIDPYENPIASCQDVCRKLLFKETKASRGSGSAFERALISFQSPGQENVSPTIQFNNILHEEEFYRRNELFCSVYGKYLSKKDVKFKQITTVDLDFINQAYIRNSNLIKQVDLKVQLPVFAHYENYVLNVLTLYCSLCKGRNQKSIDKLKDECKLDRNYLMTILMHLRSKKNELRLERCMINLYNCILIDVDPLCKISEFSNRSFLLEDIQKFDIEGNSGEFFFDNCASKSLRGNDEFHQKKVGITKKVSLIDDDEVEEEKADLKDHQELKAYAKFVITKENLENQMAQYYIALFTQSDYPEHLIVPIPPAQQKEQGIMINYRLYAQFQLGYMLSILKLIKSSIDLGFNDIETNKKIFKVLPNILIAMILSQQSKEEALFKFEQTKIWDWNIERISSNIVKNEFFKKIMDTEAPIPWLLIFLCWTTANANDDLLCMKVYLEAISMLQTFQKLKTNLQMIKFLGLEHDNNSCKRSLKKKKSKTSNAFDQFSGLLKSHDSLEDKDDELRGFDKKGFFDIFSERNGLNISALLFNGLYTSSGRTKLNEVLITILIKNFNQLQTLNDQMKEVEIIDDVFELELFTIINGNSKKNPLLSPKEATQHIHKAYRYISNRNNCQTSQTQNAKAHQEAFEMISTYVNNLNELFTSKLKEKQNYMSSLQNIIRNANIHHILSQLLLDPTNVYCAKGVSIVLFYKNLITFFEFFILDNERNQQEARQFIEAFLDIIRIAQIQAVDMTYIPLKVTRLVISILSKTHSDKSTDLIIKLIFDRLALIGQNLKKSSGFFSSIAIADDAEEYGMHIVPLNKQDSAVQQQVNKKRPLDKDIIDLSSSIQYLKILKSLTKTHTSPSEPIITNKHLILTSMFKSPYLFFVLQPANFFQELKISNMGQLIQSEAIDPTINYYQIKLHSNAIILLTDCCHYYRLGIQETQRIILYDQLKAVLLQPSCFYIIKRAYLMCLFEIYINQVREGSQSNEVIENDEVRGVLSGIIIPELDQKQVYKFLEGLARPISNNKESRLVNKDLRRQIAQQKVVYFEKSKEFKSVNREDSMQIEKSGLTQDPVKRQIPSILRDLSEYWKYIRDHGLIHFLVSTFDEMKDRVDLERSEESSLADEFAIIKQNVQKMKDTFNTLERDFRMKKEDLYLDEYRLLITSIEEIIPQRKITKFGKNFRIGFAPQTRLQFDKYDTTQEDLGGEKKIQEQENVQVITSPFKRNLKIYLMRHFIQIEDLLAFIESRSGVPEKKQIAQALLPVVNYYKNYIHSKEIDDLQNDEMSKLKQALQLKGSEAGDQSKLDLTDWTIFKQTMVSIFQKKGQGQMKVIIDLKEQEHLRNEEKLRTIRKKFAKLVTTAVNDQIAERKKDDEEEIDEKTEPDQPQDDDQIETVMSDSLIKQLLKNLEEQQEITLLENLPLFLVRCKNIFANSEIYLIKICRILLTTKRPNSDELENIGQQDKDKASEAQAKLDTFRKYQLVIAEGDIDMMALEMLVSKGAEISDQIEAISFLISLLEYGNKDVQEKILKNLKSKLSLKHQFFSLLRKFFCSSLEDEFKLIKDQYVRETQQAKLYNMMQPHRETTFEIMCIKILKLLQVFCENVFEDFQSFLVIQNEDDSYTSNTNIVNEVGNFISNILEDDLLTMLQKNQMICQGIESLIEFSTGQQGNRKDICKNKRLFSLLNQKIVLELSKDFEQERNQITGDFEGYFEQARDLDTAQKGKYKQRNESYSTLNSFVRLILAMSQGNTDQESMGCLNGIINTNKLLAIMNDIYEQRIKPKEHYVVLDKICPEDKQGQHALCIDTFCTQNFRSDEDNLLIRTGFNIFNYFLYMFDMFPEEEKLSLFYFDQEKDDEDKQVPVKEEKKPQSKASQVQVQPLSQSFEKNQYYEVNQNDQESDQVQELKAHLYNAKSEVNREITRKDASFRFYRTFTGRMEICKLDGQLQKVFFQKPFICRYLTPYIKHHLIFASNRESDEDRVLSVIENIDYYEVQMVHNQRMTSNRVLNLGAKNWRLLKDLSFLLCLIIVIILIIYYDIVISSNFSDDDAEILKYTQNDPSKTFIYYFNNAVTVVQLILNFIIVVFSAIERYPISITYRQRATNSKKVLMLQKEAGFGISSLMILYHSIVGYIEKEFEPNKVKDSYIRQAILIFMDFDNFYNSTNQLILFGLTIFAFQNPFIYAILLLDIVKRSEDLQNIIRSITLNSMNLVKFSFLGFVGFLLYAILAFNYLVEDFDEESGAYADNFYLAVTTTINYGNPNLQQNGFKGLRNGGGLAESFVPMPDPSEFGEHYWGRYFFDFSFFIVFNILFLQIIFGIILDTFGQLRDQRNDLLKEIEGKCFVCSLSRNDIDTKGEFGWFYHIYLEHNAFHMLYYLIYIKMKNLNDCDSLEKYVKTCIEEKNTDFFPKGQALQIKS